MKVGDQIPVTINNQTVTSAVIEEIADGTVTLAFPATRVVMGYTMSLTDKPISDEKETIVLGPDE